MNELFDVSGRSALVTGGSRGIGRMIAQGLVQAGANVVISSRKADELERPATWGAPLEEFPAAGWDKVIHTNAEGIFYLTTALLPSLRAAATESDPARVINIGSIDGLRVPMMENYSYSASKAAVHMLTRHLAKRLAAEHITVNAIAPGPFESR